MTSTAASHLLAALRPVKLLPLTAPRGSPVARGRATEQERPRGERLASGPVDRRVAVAERPPAALDGAPDDARVVPDRLRLAGLLPQTTVHGQAQLD